MSARRPYSQPEMPENSPKMGNALTRWTGRSMLRLMGWRIEGEIPNIRQIVICAAPHTSNWDFVVGMFVVLALGVRFSFLMKEEAFVWPLKGLFMRLGGIPLNRREAEDIVEHTVNWYQNHDQVWLAITPEGTRSKVEKWKTGFLRIAHQANVPILLVAWHYPERVLLIDRVQNASGDHASDIAELQSYYCQRFVGKHPERQ